MSLFVDTSAWYAASDEGETRNARAVEILREAELVTSDHVIVETWQLLERRFDRQVAEQFWEGIRSSGATIEPTTGADLEAAWAIGQIFADQGFSIVDRTCFAVMERLGIHEVASFDVHFAIYRFGSRRNRAFSVLN